MLVLHQQLLFDLARHPVALVLVKVVLQAHSLGHDLVHEQIVLVQEQYGGYVVHVAIDPNGPERLERLAQPIHTVVFAQRHVKRADVDDKYDGGDLIEALQPLATLISLAADIENVKANVLVGKRGLLDARGQRATPQYVLVVGQIGGLADRAHPVQEVARIVRQMVQIAQLGALFHALVSPQRLYARPQLTHLVHVVRLVGRETIETAAQREAARIVRYGELGQAHLMVTVVTLAADELPMILEIVSGLLHVDQQIGVVEDEPLRLLQIRILQSYSKSIHGIQNGQNDIVNVALYVSDLFQPLLDAKVRVVYDAHLLDHGRLA